MSHVIDVVLTAQDAEKCDVAGRTVCVVDVLRATTSILCALRAGAQAVYPVESVEDARGMKNELPDGLLCGERHGTPPEGFDMGNSPADFLKARVAGKNIILTTTNGTLAISNSRKAEAIIAVSLMNARSAARYLLAEPRDLTIVCAGTGGVFSIEDFYCAGTVVSALVNSSFGAPTDLAWAAAALSRHPVAEVVNRDTCRHFGVLQKKGFERDLKLALRPEPDSSPLNVPLLDAKMGGFILAG